jgi:hypothetical protein
MQAYHARVREAMAHYLRVKKSPRFTGTLGAVAIFLVVIGVVTAAMLIAAREPSRADIARLEAQPEEPTAEASSKRASTSKTPSISTAPATRLAAAMTPVNALHESAPNAPVPTPAAVTIAGCLERYDETFRLKDTTGVDAPKSRSWRSGFLKKGSSSIEVVDAANRLKLTDHVGQRVSVTGVLVDREIRVRSLQRVATSCTS